jgi:hypothetical protein
MTQNAVNEIGHFPSTRHARPCAGHPRLRFDQPRKTWMAGTSPALTKKTALFQAVEKCMETLVAFSVRLSG